MQKLRQQLLEGACMMNLRVSKAQADKMVEYLSLLDKWNKTFNLTAVRHPDLMVSRHLLDSLGILPRIPEAGNILDVGSGAGLPGIPLAIMRPKVSWSLLDSNGKKTRFLTHVTHTLGLDNINVVQQRVESYNAGITFDLIMSRAFASLADFTQMTGPLLAKRGQWLAMKGTYPEEEINALNTNVTIKSVDTLNIPGCDGERHLVIMECSNV